MIRILTLCILAFVTPLASAASLLVLNKDDATLSIFDPATGQQRGANIPTGNGPHEVEVSGDGSLAFVSNYGTVQAPGTSLSVIDVRAAKERTRVDLGELRRPHGLAVQGQSVYLTSEDTQQVARYDAVKNRVDWRFSTGQQRTHMVLVARDRTLITANIQSDNVSFITPKGDTGTQVLVATGKGPEGMDLTPDGRQLWTANSGDGSISIVDVATKKLVKTFDVGTKRSNRLKFTPDGAVALVSDLTAGELLIVDARAHTVKSRLPVGPGATGVLVGPDGTRAYVAASSAGKIVIVDLKKWEIAGEIRAGRGPDGMAWVP